MFFNANKFSKELSEYVEEQKEDRRQRRLRIDEIAQDGIKNSTGSEKAIIELLSIIAKQGV